ncbi:hypothetical protein TWF696_005730 [Orbilia brochopaga]|uniref:Uncharacterized protein n=1 Tax=Orbilia brochopaga TaxID=3140254 RepID=A0AAV9UXE0_9PEZI
MSSPPPGFGAQSSSTTDMHDKAIRPKRKRSESVVSAANVNEVREIVQKTWAGLSPEARQMFEEWFESKKTTSVIAISTMSQEAVWLNFSSSLNMYPQHASDLVWDVASEIKPDFLKDFQLPSPALENFRWKYGMFVDRNTEAMCRSLIDVLLLEAIVLYYASLEITGSKKGKISEDQVTEGQDLEAGNPGKSKGKGKGKAQKKAPSSPAGLGSGVPSTGLRTDDLESMVGSITGRQRHSLQLLGEVAVEYENETKTKVFRGRMDYCLAIRSNFKTSEPESSLSGLRSPIFSVLAVAEAKQGDTIQSAAGQLLGYLAVLYESRKRKSRPDCSTFGIATDGYLWTFYKVTHNGVVFKTHTMSLGLPGYSEHILKTIVYVIGESIRASTPYTSPEDGSPEPDILFETPAAVLPTGEQREEEEEE